MIKKDLVFKVCSLLFWSLAILSYYFQFPFRDLASFIIPCFALFLLFECPNIKIIKDKKYIIILIIFYIYLSFNLIYSINKGIDLTRYLRFFLILSAISVCIMIQEKNFIMFEKIFIYLSTAKALLLIAIAIYLVIVGNHNTIRGWAQINEFGDIYLLNRFVPKVQVQGNALLVIAFIAEYMRVKKINFKSGVIFLGIIAAGNFAFILALSLFGCFRMIPYLIYLFNNKKINIKYFIILLLLFMLILLPYLKKKIDEKSTFSNKARFEQAEVLLETKILTGNGLGNYIQATTSTRIYDGDIYFELQTLYIINQIGLLGFFLFYFIILLPFFTVSKTKLILYLIYIVYTFWNPYCFDTTQMFVTVIVYNMFIQGEQNEDSSYYGLLSNKR